jgi:hypothetical protein
MPDTRPALRTESRRRVAVVAAGALLTAASAGCGGNEAARAPESCPPVAKIGEASSLTRFASGRGRDLTDVAWEVVIIDVPTRCGRSASDRSGPPAMVVELAPVIAATRGPAGRETQARFELFVSVLDDARTVLAKEVFPLTADFSGNRNRVVIREDDPPISVDLPLADGRAAASYQVVVGLQLNAEDLDYNRRRYGGSR